MGWRKYWRGVRQEISEAERNLYDQNRGEYPCKNNAIYLPEDIKYWVRDEAERRGIPITWVWLDVIRAGMVRLTEDMRPDSKPIHKKDERIGFTLPGM